MYFRKLSKPQRLFTKRCNAMMRKRCPKGVYKALFGKSALRELDPIYVAERYMHKCPYHMVGLARRIM